MYSTCSCEKKSSEKFKACLLCTIKYPYYENMAVKEKTPEQRWLRALHMRQLKANSINWRKSGSELKDKHFFIIMEIIFKNSWNHPLPGVKFQLCLNLKLCWIYRTKISVLFDSRSELTVTRSGVDDNLDNIQLFWWNVRRWVMISESLGVSSRDQTEK